MKKLWLSIRFWLIGALTKDMFVMINVSVRGGTIYIPEKPIVMRHGTFINNKFHCETPEMDATILEIIRVSNAPATPSPER